MKKLTFSALVIICFSVTLSAQVFNTSGTLKKGTFSAGFEPGVYVDPSDFNLFLHGGAGLTSNIDLGVKLGVLGDETYFGGDVEFGVGKIFSLSAGAHSYFDFGLDFTGLFTFPIGGVADLYTGLDVDVAFAENDTYFPIWIPIGLEIPLKKDILFLFEAEINVNDEYYGRHWFGGGLNFIF